MPYQSGEGRRRFFRRLLKSKTALAGLFIVSVFLITAILADLISPYAGGIEMNDAVRLQAPGPAHPFGTDNYGRDVFTRVIHGGRFTLSLGIAAAALSLFFAFVLGSLAGYFGGRIDGFIMRIMDTILCVPGILLSLAVVAALGPGARNLLIAVAVSYVPHFTRLIRSVVLTIVKNDYIEAARASGTGPVGIVCRHVIRNALGPIIVETAMAIAAIILFSAGLSFIGLGVQPPAPEWGAMLSDAREFLRRAPHLMIFPGAAIVLSSLSFNLLGDGLRDVLDPRIEDRGF
jgi:peptide/nickel transport system permease protein